MPDLEGLETKRASLPTSRMKLCLDGCLDCQAPILRSFLSSVASREGQASFRSTPFMEVSTHPVEHAGQLSFAAWLARWHQDLSILLREHPTWDYRPVPRETCEVVAMDIKLLASSGRNVTLVDSGGQQRTGQVCAYMSAVEDTSQVVMHKQPAD